MSRINRGHKRKVELRETAEKNAEQRAQRSPAQQLELLDKRFGPGLGAQKERRRLSALIDGPVSHKEDKEPRTRNERRKAKAKRHKEREQRDNPDI